MIITAICLLLGLGATLANYFLTSWSSLPWPYAFLMIPTWLGYYLAAFAVFVLSFFLYCMMFPLTRDIQKPRKGAYWCSCQIIHWLFGFLWIKTHITGAEKLPKGQRFLMVSNHLSMFDFLVVLAHLGQYGIIPIFKKEAESIPIVGKVAHYTGFIPIDRENPVKGLRAILKGIKFIKEGTGSVYIAPEGTRNKDGKMSPFHAGSFKIAEKTKCPVIVCAVAGTNDIHKNYFRRVSHVSFDVLEVISSEEVAALSTVELAEKAQGLIQARLDEIEHKE